jgi:hypothetical protein
VNQAKKGRGCERVRGSNKACGRSRWNQRGISEGPTRGALQSVHERLRRQSPSNSAQRARIFNVFGGSRGIVPCDEDISGGRDILGAFCIAGAFSGAAETAWQ